MKGKDKLYQARMDGLVYALDLVKRGGVEKLENEIKIRGAHFIPLEITEEKRIEIGDFLANRIISTLTPTVMFCLYDTFGFGRTRLMRWKDAFIGLCDMLSKTDPMGAQYETARDYAKVLKDKFDIDFDWSTIDAVTEDNAKFKKQYCELDYVINLLQENGQAEAAKILKEYKVRK